MDKQAHQGVIGKALSQLRPTTVIDKMPIALRSQQPQRKISSADLKRNQPVKAALPIATRSQTINFDAI
ncbi:MAG: hypothetical protein AAF337_04660 [Pseudomonadota bacterium]